MRWTVLVAAAVLLGSGSSAGAQVPPGQPAQPNEQVPQKTRSDRIAHCTLARARGAAIVLVRNYGTPAETNGRTRIEQALGGCMGARSTSITVSTEDLAAAFAEILLEEQQGKLLARADAATPIAPQRLTARSDHERLEIFECTVGAQPRDAASLIRSAAATPAEAAAFRTMIPSLQACVPSHYEMHMKPYEVRSFVAIALYRRVADRTGG